MMSIIEFIESKDCPVLDIDMQIWFVGWEECHIMGRAYDGWDELNEVEYLDYASIVSDYLVYEREFAKGMCDHYVDNVPGAAISGNGVRGKCREAVL